MGVPTLPAWFKPTPGFRFLNPHGDLVIVLGLGRFCKFDPMGSVNIELPAVHETIYMSHMATDAIVAAYKHQNEWLMCNLATEDDMFWRKSAPVTDETSIANHS